MALGLSLLENLRHFFRPLRTLESFSTPHKVAVKLITRPILLPAFETNLVSDCVSVTMHPRTLGAIVVETGLRGI